MDSNPLAVEGKNTGDDSDAPPVDLAEEAEAAYKSTGEENTGGDDLPAIEFYYGKVKKDGRTVKTGKVYWEYTIYEGGQRKRVSPTKVLGKVRGITSIDKCPYKGRVLEFQRRSLTFPVTNTGGTNTGGAVPDGRLQGAERCSAEELANE